MKLKNILLLIVILIFFLEISTPEHVNPQQTQLPEVFEYFYQGFCNSAFRSRVLSLASQVNLPRIFRFKVGRQYLLLASQDCHVYSSKSADRNFDTTYLNKIRLQTDLGDVKITVEGRSSEDNNSEEIYISAEKVEGGKATMLNRESTDTLYYIFHSRGMKVILTIRLYTSLDPTSASSSSLHYLEVTIENCDFNLTEQDHAVEIKIDNELQANDVLNNQREEKVDKIANNLTNIALGLVFSFSFGSSVYLFFFCPWSTAEHHIMVAMVSGALFKFGDYILTHQNDRPIATMLRDYLFKVFKKVVKRCV